MQRDSKLPEVTLAFWVMKICATTLGETAGDLLSMTLALGYAASTVLLLAAFLSTLAAQLRARTFHPALYWLVILTTSTGGTTLSDFLDRTVGLGYASGSTLLAALLAGVLGVWWASGETLSVTDIRSGRAEVFYWTAILVSNTLGTALGDFVADDSGLGFAGGAALIGAALVLVGAAARFTRTSPVVSFWLAFVLTRPFGATIGDLLTKAPHQGGIGLGTVGASSMLLLVLGALVGRSAAGGSEVEAR